MFIGLDNFKAINNSLGHAAGDEVLAEVANRLQVCVRNVDTVARWSGDEFTALLEGMSKPDDAVVVARRMMVALSRPILIGREELYATVSVGIATYPGDGESSEALLKNADAAMSRAKRSGGDHYQLYSSEMNVRVAERLSLRNRLRSALDRNEFVLHYQPQVDFRTGRVITLEALLRWREPEGGLRPPAEFIPLLEETGLIVPVGEWVLREACTQSRRWEEAGLRNVRVAVNLSARQFRQKELSQTVAGIIEEVGLDPDRLELELTESMLMDEENSRRTLGELKAMGLRVSLDDFGTGYSSLGFLRQFPVDSLKIDRAFIRDICEEEQDRAICAAIVALARALNLEVVAEGVETPSQLRLLQNQGCHLVQGFVYARPLPALEIWRWLHERWELDPAART
jgi:diguanylate cyclase (GGDEF)-like protein